MKNRVKTKMDMLNGRMMKKLIALALPLAFSGILQLLFNAADLIVIGQLSATPDESLAAVSSNGSLISLIINLAIGLSVGANVVMAQALGARNYEKAGRTLHTALVIAAICGVVMGIIGFFGARFFLTLMKVDSQVLDKSTLYLRVIFLGMPANIVYNFGAALLRAKGDTVRPMLFLAIGGVLNVGLNVVFVLLGMDVLGVSLATILSQYVSAVFLILALLGESDECKLVWKRLRIHKEELKDVVRIGLPSGLLSTCFSLSNVIIQSFVNAFGYKLVAGNSASQNIEGFVYTAMNAVSVASLTFAGQNYGAKKYDRIQGVMWRGSLITFGVWAVLGGAIMLLGRQISSLYVSGEELIGYSLDRMFIIVPLYFLCGINEVFVSGLRSTGRTIGPLIISVFCTCIFRIVWVFTACEIVHTPQMVYLSYPISWALNLIITLVYFIVVFKKIINRAKAEQQPAALSTDESL